MSREITFNIPFTAVVESGPEQMAYVKHDKVGALTAYGPESRVKPKLRNMMIAEIEDALTAKKSLSALAIGCSTGDTFIVRYSFGGWSYAIAGPGRKSGSACTTGGFKNFDAAVQAARFHAAQNGTILWECNL